jgi:hypothetical protein
MHPQQRQSHNIATRATLSFPQQRHSCNIVIAVTSTVLQQFFNNVTASISSYKGGNPGKATVQTLHGETVTGNGKGPDR